MLVTNNTNQDYWFGPLHLGAGVGLTLTVDDTTATSLYLTEDAVADAINNLYLTGKIAVSGAASPFPRPTGVPALLHGDGSPEGLVFAPQGSVYMRRDNSGVSTSLYAKTTGITINTGWIGVSPSGTIAAPTGAIQAFGGSSAPADWLICDGAAVSRTTYSTLFGVVATLYGAGDGSTTFNVPDLRGRTMVGFAASGGHADVSTLGLSDGVAVANRRAKHRHTPHTHTASFQAGAFNPGNLTANLAPNHSENTGVVGMGVSVSSVDGGSGNSSDSLDAPSYLVVNHIIKA
jgi:microcystin-dependent protein